MSILGKSCKVGIAQSSVHHHALSWRDDVHMAIALHVGITITACAAVVAVNDVSDFCSCSCESMSPEAACHTLYTAVMVFVSMCCTDQRCCCPVDAGPCMCSTGAVCAVLSWFV